MAWSELTNQRTERSRTYQDSEGHGWMSCVIAPLHYDDGSGSLATIDAAPVRVNNAQLNGWTITANGWHYALGQPKSGAFSGTDGVVGFGGRRGQNWLRYRLTRVGYLHWPTRAWQDVGGAPAYTRTNLSRQTNSRTIGPNDDAVNVESVATWTGLWTTPGSGDVSARWRVDGGQLKEDITINQAAREWIVANRPPTTPLDETWFGFVFRVDWSDIPVIVRAGIVQSSEDDFADDDVGIGLHDALDRVLAFLPVSFVSAGVHASRTDPPQDRAQLRKRFWHDGDGNYYMLVGIRCDTVAAMRAGPLVFDPTTLPTEQVGAGADDGHELPGASVADNHAVTVQMGDNNGSIWSLFRFQTVGLANAVTINTAVFTIKSHDTYHGPAMAVNVYCEDIDDSPAIVENANNIDGRTCTGNYTANWDIHDMTADSNYAVSIVSAVQEVVSRIGWASGNDLSVIIQDSTCPAYEYQQAYSYDHTAANAAKLDITYTAGGGYQPRSPIATINDMMGI